MAAFGDPNLHFRWNVDGGYSLQYVAPGSSRVWMGFGGKTSRPGQVKAEDAASPLGNPIPKLVGTASFVGQLIIDVDHFGGVRLKG
jgi:hypothetical protein